jgi:hypothetical protein
MSSLLKRITPLAAQVRGNPRLQSGIIVIGLLLLAWIWIVLGDWRDALRSETSQVQSRALRMQSLAGQEVWHERATEAEQVEQRLIAELPFADSPGLAQAGLQSWLRDIVAPTGTDMRIGVEPPVRLETPPGALRITATVAGSLPGRQVQDIIRRIESHANLMTVESALIQSDVNQTYSITLHAYYRLRDEATP